MTTGRLSDLAVQLSVLRYPSTPPGSQHSPARHAVLVSYLAYRAGRAAAAYSLFRVAAQYNRESALPYLRVILAGLSVRDTHRAMIAYRGALRRGDLVRDCVWGGTVSQIPERYAEWGQYVLEDVRDTVAALKWIGRAAALGVMDATAGDT